MANSPSKVDLRDLRAFIAASANEIVFLRQARDALVTHPKFAADIGDTDAALCRVLTIAAVATIERALEAWRDAPFLEPYNSDKISNGEKIRLLGDRNLSMK